MPSSSDLLRRVDESLAGLTGETFFLTLARSLAEALNAHCAFVCEFLSDNSVARPLAFWLHGDHVGAEAYDLAGTPCECVLAGEIVAFTDGVAERFVYHREELEAVDANSYIAIPMTTRGGRVIGHIAVIDRHKRDWAEADADILRLCSSRASGELEHEQTQRRLAAANSALEDRVRARTRELERANEEMEEHVAERTASLAAVNARLRHEVAARMEAESALRRQEEAYRDLYENAPNVYWSTGIDGLIKRANRRAVELFGFTREELVGKPYIELVAPGPKGRDKAKWIFGRFLEGQPTYAEQLEFRAADGRSIWANVSVVPIFDETGKPLATRSVLDDITERKRAEEALNRRLDLERLIAEVATEFVGSRPEDIDSGFSRAIAKIGTWGDWDGVRVFLGHTDSSSPRLAYEWSPIATKMTDRKPSIRRRFRSNNEAVIDVPDVSRLAAGALKRSLTSSRVGAVIVVPVQNATASLGFIEFVRLARPHDWLTEDVQLLRLLGEIMAGTLQRCAAERELQKARAIAEAASQAKSEFLARMSHELRTPLNAILGYAQLMQRDSDLSKNERDQVETIHRSGEHLLTLINEVLDLARIESGRLDVRDVDVDLLRLLRDIAAMVRPRAEQAGLRFGLECADDVPARVAADDRRLRQILLNLLGNALKFTPRGGAVTLRVGTSEKREDRCNLLLSIEDTGIGIAPEKLARIFEPFYQVSNDPTEGIGLGLAITQRLVAAMQGSIDVESDIGRGSTFRICLPLVTLQPARGDISKAARAPVIGFDGDRRRILIADDRSENRAVLRNLLEPLGFHVTEAADGRAALGAVEESSPDLLLIDLVMPKLDGFEVIARVRKLPQAHDLKIVAVSANAFEETRERCAKLGCDAFLAKPVDLDETLATIGKLLDLEWRRRDGRLDPRRHLDVWNGAPASHLPPQRLAELRELARAGDVVAISSCLNELERDERHREFVDYMRPLAVSFDLRSIEHSLEFLARIRDDEDRTAR